MSQATATEVENFQLLSLVAAIFQYDIIIRHMLDCATNQNARLQIQFICRWSLRFCCFHLTICRSEFCRQLLRLILIGNAPLLKNRID